MATKETKELGKFKGWRLVESTTDNGVPLYMAFYDIAPDKAPAMLHHADLDKLKTKIDGIRFYKGRLSYISQKAREI